MAKKGLTVAVGLKRESWKPLHGAHRDVEGHHKWPDKITEQPELLPGPASLEAEKAQSQSKWRGGPERPIKEGDSAEPWKKELQFITC